MKEQICTHETSLLLKRLGFHEEVMDFYFKGKFNDDSDPSGSYTGFGLFEDFNNDSDDYVSAPTQSLAMRWLREEKRIFVEVYRNYVTQDWRSIANIFGGAHNGIVLGRGTYEEALEAGIKAACRHLLDEIRTHQDTIDAFACTCYILKNKKEQC